MDNLTFSIHQLLALLYQISGIKENGQLSLTVLLIAFAIGALAL